MRLIDAEVLSLELYKRINQMTLEDEKLSAYQALLIAMGLVQEAPTIDAVPVVHGRWIETSIPKRYGGKRTVCSNCGESPDWYYNFCPNCGAKMDGKDGDADADE